MASPALAQRRLDVPQAAVDAAVASVQSRAAALGLSDADVSTLVVVDGHTDERTGLTVVYLRQQLDGLDVVGAQATVGLGRDGRVLHAAGDLVAGLAEAARPTAGGNRAASLSAVGALRAAAGHVRVLVGGVAVEAAAAGPAQATDLLVDGLSSPSKARQVYFRADDGALRRAWEVTLDDARSEHWWVVTVDAATGAELGRYDLTVSESFGDAEASGTARSFAPVAARAASQAASPLLDPEAFGASLVAGYKVFALPLASPLYASTPPPADGRTTVSGAEDATASPFGWHDTNGAAGAEFTVTRGNNTHTYIDRDDNEAPDALYPAPDGGATLSFDYPINFSLTPNLYTDASATNLFYLSNVIHDITYKYGFTEAAGNFQQNNYGRGGAGNDAVDSEVQSGADICNETNPCHNNANFASPPDGSRPRMQMYDGTNPTPAVDGSLDAHVVVHEYGHGISTRLVGGPATTSCLNNTEQMGEGWSDWYGNMLTMRPGDTRTTRRPVGNYLFGQPTSGIGIRPAPYTTDFAVNNYTYQRTRSGLSVPHGIGFVWATALWEATWDMVDAYGFDPDLYDASGTAGNQMMLNLVTTGLKLTPCSPGFVTGRDAILAADAALYPDPAEAGVGVHYDLLWAAFARRGLGFSASQGSAGSNADNTEAFDLPLPLAVASVASSPISFLRPAGGTASTTVSVANTAAAGSQTLTVSAAIRAASPASRPASRAVDAVPSGEIVAHGRASAGKAGAAAPAAETEAPETSSSGAAARLLGGSDAVGYSWLGSDEAGGPAYNWVDISTTGTAVTLGDDAATTDIALPFAFSLYGTSRSSVKILSNGLLVLGTGNANAGATGNNRSIPDVTAPNLIIAPYWVDLNPAVGGQIRYRDMGDGRFVVSWIGVPRYTDPGQNGGAFTFQAILYPNGEVVYQYQTLTLGDFANSGTIGVENAAGTVGLQVPSATATNGKAVRIVPPPTWASVSPTSATAAPGASANLTVTVNAAGLTEGTYRAELVVTTNATNARTTVIPLTLTVGGTASVAGAAGWRLLAAPAVGVTVDDLAAMNLVQGVPGYYPGVGANLLTDYDGAAYSSAGTGATLAPGKGFFWYFYNQTLTPGGASNSVPLPMTLATTKPAVTTDTDVTLHASGNKANMLGNPFGVSLNVSEASVATWPGASNLNSVVVQTWSPAGNTFETSTTRPVVSPWQGFFAEGKTTGTLTIPTAAQTTGGVLQRGASAPLVAFELAQADPGSGAGAGSVLVDRAAVLTFPEGATAGRDAFDAVKLAPLAAEFVSAAFETEGDLRAVDSRPAPAGAAIEAALHVGSVGAGERLVLSWPLVENVPGTWDLALVDLQTGQTVDLRTTTSYAFTVRPEAARDPLAASAQAVASGPARFVVTVGPRRSTGAEAAGTAVLALEAPRPNPARSRSTVAYTLPEAGAVRLSVVDLLGREVAVVASGDQTAGRHEAEVDGSSLAPGVYVMRLSAGRESLTRRLVVVR